MKVDVTLSDDVKRAVRYLGLAPEQVDEALVMACEKRLAIYVSNAKLRHASQQNMESISPEPLT